MKKLFIISITVFYLSLSATATPSSFGAGHNNATSEDVKRETREAAETTKAFLQQKKEEYQKKAEAKLKRLQYKIKKFHSSAERAETKNREKLSKTADELKKKQEATREKLNELKTTSFEMWDKIKTELESALSDLESTYKRAVSPAEKKSNNPVSK